MSINNKLKGYKVIAAVCGLMLTFGSCEKFVELGPPPTQTVLSDVFKTDATATSAVLAMYSSSGGSLNSIVLNNTVYPGMSADDIQYNTVSAMYDEFESNAINAATNTLNENNLWATNYQVIKNANNAISGLTTSQTLTKSVKDQLLGEAKFVRAFVYFHLVNMYGDVPMPLKDDASFEENALLSRKPAADVWMQIVTDLKDAETLLPSAYAGTPRARVNKWAASTLLARAYLYTKDYANAEATATNVINSGVYSLPAPAAAFVNTSNEIILQLSNLTGVSTFGANYLAATGVVPTYSLYDTIYKSFTAPDLRKTNWAGVTTVSAKPYYFVNKYKVRSGTGTEFNIVLRFAELYLIRGEARAQLGNVATAKADLDVVRARAGLSALSSTITQAQLLVAIEEERKLEFFGEWGHRWFDLKRTKRVDAVIGGQKGATWSATDALYPIPETQRQANTNLTQNPGY